MKRIHTEPDAEKMPLDPGRQALWRIRHHGLKRASDHYLVQFTRWWTGATAVSLSYEGEPPAQQKPIDQPTGGA